MEPGEPKIHAGQVPALVLDACPSFAVVWDEIVEEHTDRGSPGGRLGYLDAGCLVAHLADRLLTGDTVDFDAVFDLIERLITDGDPYVSELGVIGYLEGMQMATVSSRGVDPEAFRPWLRPVSSAYWEAINRFWMLGTPIPDIRRKEG